MPKTKPFYFNEVSKAAALRIMDRILKHPCSIPFREHDFYESALKTNNRVQPICLSMIIQRININDYQSPAEWQRDMKRILQNSIEIYGNDNYITILANQLYHIFEKEFEGFVCYSVNKWTKMVALMTRQLIFKMTNRPPTDINVITEINATLIQGYPYLPPYDESAEEESSQNTNALTSSDDSAPYNTTKQNEKMIHEKNNKSDDGYFVNSVLNSPLINKSEQISRSDSASDQKSYLSINYINNTPNRVQDISIKNLNNDQSGYYNNNTVQTNNYISSNKSLVGLNKNSNQTSPNKNSFNAFNISNIINHDTTSNSTSQTYVVNRHSYSNNENNFTNNLLNNDHNTVGTKTYSGIHSTNNTIDRPIVHNNYNNNGKKLPVNSFPVSNSIAKNNKVTNIINNNNTNNDPPQNRKNINSYVPIKKEEKYISPKEKARHEISCFLTAFGSLRSKNDAKTIVEIILSEQPDFEIEEPNPAIVFEDLNQSTVRKLIEYTKERFEELGMTYPT